MTRLAISVLTLYTACAGGGSTTGDEQFATELKPFDLMHTRPECAHEGKPSSWCTHEDAPAAAKLSGMEERVAEMIDRAQDKDTAKIVIAYFSFSNKAVFNKLCEKGKSGFSVEGFFDQSYRALMPAELAQKCQGPQGNNVVMHFLGQTQQEPNFIWRLHHNKFLIVDPGDGSLVSVNFSSGNLSSFGLSVHFDHWGVLHAEPTSNLVRMQECVVEGLRAAINPDLQGPDELIDDPAVYRETLNDCLSRKNTLFRSGIAWTEKAIAQEQIAPLFSPDPANNNARVLIDNINRVEASGRIFGAMQHFLHYNIAAALRSAVQRGVDVRLIMDNDVMSGEGEVPGVQEFYTDNLKPSATGIDVRFLVTNAEARQMMHNKFLVMDGVDGDKTRVFSGAGHFTNSGLRNNYENFYLSQNTGLSEAYETLFDYMWRRTVSEAEASPQ